MVVEQAFRRLEQLIYVQQVGLKTDKAARVSSFTIAVDARGTQHKGARVMHACSPFLSMPLAVRSRGYR